MKCLNSKTIYYKKNTHKFESFIDVILVKEYIKITGKSKNNIKRLLLDLLT